MEKEFEIYISKIVNKLKCNKGEKAAIAEEIQDHLLLLKKEFLEKGYSKESAIKLAISSFGEEDMIGRKIQEVMYPYQIVKGSFGLIFTLIGLYGLIWWHQVLWNSGGPDIGRNTIQYYVPYFVTSSIMFIGLFYSIKSINKLINEKIIKQLM